MPESPPPPSAARAWLLGRPGHPGFAARVAVGLPYTAFLIGTYQLVARLVHPGGGGDLSTRLDLAVPFLPWTVWFYVPGYALCFLLPIAAIDEWAYFFRTAAALFVASVPAWTVHALYPIAYPRPPAPAGPGLDLSMLRWVYAFDPPHNTFPSLHVSLAVVMMAASWGWSRRLGAVVTALSTAMIVSVLTLKQHFVADIVGGFASASVAWALLLKGQGRA